MQADPHPQLLGPWISFRKGPLDPDRATHGVTGRREGQHEAVTLRLHLEPRVDRGLGSHDLVVLAQQGHPLAVAEPLCELCRPLDVREQDRRGAVWGCWGRDGGARAPSVAILSSGPSWRKRAIAGPCTKSSRSKTCRTSISPSTFMSWVGHGNRIAHPMASSRDRTWMMV